MVTSGGGSRANSRVDLTTRAPSPAGSVYQADTLGHVTSSRRGSVSSEPTEVAPGHVKLVKDKNRFWYMPTITREEAITILKTQIPGTFIVRDSNSFPGAFGLALKVSTPPQNNNNKSVAIKAEPLNQQFSQLLREIQNFKALESTGFPTLLK